jgi:hypothetical protein
MAGLCVDVLVKLSTAPALRSTCPVLTERAFPARDATGAAKQHKHTQRTTDDCNQPGRRRF